MARVRLTNERIKKAVLMPGLKSRTGKTINQIFLWDTETPGLAARITAGAKSFIYQGRVGDKEIRSTIGKCSAWTLDDARKEARRLQGLIDRGIDPREQKKKQKEDREKAKKKAESALKYTLGALLDAYAEYTEGKGKRRFAGAVRSATKCHLTEADPHLAATPAREVTSRQIAGLIRRVTEAGKERTAGAFRSYLSAAFNCARKSPVSAALPSSFIGFEVESNPVDPVPPIPVRARHRTLSREELNAYINYLRDDLVALALKLALYSGGQRMAQLLRAEVADWIPEIRTLRLMDPKGKRTEPREHLLPLGPVATSVVTKLVRRAEREETLLLFGSSDRSPEIYWRGPGDRVSEISTAMGGESFGLMDIRRTVETMLAGLGISRDIRAQVLSHGISGVQAVHYDRHDYLKEKRAALVRWERYLKRITSDEEEKKVVSIAEVKGGRYR